MSASFNPRLLVPPEEEEVYPYRRVWRSVGIESLALLVVALGLYVLASFAGVVLPSPLHRPINVALALLPLGLWAIFALLQERFVPQPRHRLITVVLISALAANAVGIPFVDDFLQVDRWLPMSSALTRIAGYTFTVGIVQELIKYIVVYYTVWPDSLRVRLDGVAYMRAAAVGYATVLGLQYAFSTAAAPDMMAMRLFDIVALQYAGSIGVSYALAEVRFGHPTPLLPALALGAAATLTGIVIPIRAGLVNAGLVLGPSVASPIRGLALSAVVLLGVAVAAAFLIENADRQDRESAAARET